MSTEQSQTKKLMAEVNSLQVRLKTESAAKKAELDELISEINKLQIAAIREKDAGKASLVKEKTQHLYETQVNHLETRQHATREQLARLTLLQKHQETASDARLQHQLEEMIGKKKVEYAQLHRDVEQIHQKARQKSITLRKHVDATTAEASPQASVTERAKAEAEKLISEVQPGVRNLADSSNKAEEATKLIQEINRLQAAADAGTLTEAEARQLEERVMRIETKQRQTREEINQLTQAKIKYELALAKSRQEINAQRQRKNQDGELQGELNRLIEEKENEQRQLLEELKLIRSHAEQEAAALKAQRDAARILAEKEAQDTEMVESEHSRQSLVLIGSAAAAVVVFVGVLLFTPLLDLVKQRVESIRNPPPPESAAPLSTPPANEPRGGAKAAKIKPMISDAPIDLYRDRLKSGGLGPVMARVPSGVFLMGSPDSKPYPDEKPQLAVELNSFSIGQYEVSFDDYDRFARATGREPPSDRGWGRDNRPVINVSWHEAQAYTEWLTSETGYHYRLPSEREWEFAAFAGTEYIYGWGDSFSSGKANCAQCGSLWDGVSTAPVGSFRANDFELYDMVGNVMEWTLSCYYPNYVGAPSSGYDWEGGNCAQRVVRGSAYDTTTKDLRITRRIKYSPGTGSPNLGFRVVRVD